MIANRGDNSLEDSEFISEKPIEVKDGSAAYEDGGCMQVEVKRRREIT